MNNSICTRCKGDKEINGYVKKRTICRICARLECKLYKQRNKEKISAYNKTYKQNNASEISEYNKQYNKNNRETIQKRHTKYLANKRKTDPKYKMSVCLRNRMNKLINGQQKNSTLNMIGCNYDFFMKWMKYQFKDDMTFDNHGDVWHIDHVLPCNKFDLTKEVDRERCFNWANMQPMYATQNMTKKDKITKREILLHKKIVTKFLKTVTDEKYSICKYDEGIYMNL